MDAEESAKGKEASLAAKTIQTFASMFGVLGITVISAIVLSRGLTPDDRGVYLGITMWNGFVLGLVDVGIYISTVYLIGTCLERERKDVFTTLFVWAVVTGAVAVIVVSVVTQWMTVHLEGREKWASYFFFASTFGGPVTSMLSGVLASKERYTLINVVRVGLPLILTVLWVVYFALGLLSVSLCLITSSVIAFFSVAPFLWQARHELKSLGRFRFSIFKKGIWYGFKSYGGAVISVLGGNGTQVMLFSLTPSALAFFQTANSATGVLWSVPRAVGVTSFPNLIQESRELLHGKVCRFLRLTAVSTLMGGVLLGLAEPVMIPLLFGREYLPAVIPALLLLPNAFFGGLSEVLGNALNSAGKTLHTTVATGAYVLVTLGSMLFTIGAWGISGAAISTMLGFMVSFVIRLVWYGRAVQRIAFKEICPGFQDFREVLGYSIGILRKLQVKLRGKLSAPAR
jgi:O-antigen/teichoic acid export membrane protein